jgi:primosomal protein N' (replication factor Y) (superfamily II helicase)
VLTPEIALSGATLAYFRGFFGDLVTVIHSAMTDRERLESWQGIRSGRFKIVVGPRSAIFAPLEQLGLIIVDEEHDGSYKQDEPSPRFHGRDCAIMRGKLNKIPVLLGSASPSVESYYAAKSGRYELLELLKRPGAAVLPKVRVVDMRTQGVKGHMSYVSLELKKGIEERLARKDQVILYLNRRGYAPMLRCAECGHIPVCPHCSIRMTFHKVGNRLACHYCGYVHQTYDTCEKCTGKDLQLLGTGTQKVEETLPALFPQARTVRLDSDSAAKRAGAHLILNDVAHHKYDVLLGTQMVTKGLDLPDVSLVGVLSADQGMDMPDFRSSEKSFARLLQVAGRSGRADKPGEVIVQTYAPESPVIVDAARQDFKSFYQQEIKSREAASYPPFVRLVNIVLSGQSDGEVQQEIIAFRQRLMERCSAHKIAQEMLGPAPCPLTMIRGQYRRHLIVKTNQMVRLVRMLAEWEAEQARLGLPAAIKLVVDIDPDDMM